MNEFLSSPVFLEWAAGLIIVVVVITLLWRNTVWEARGITPVADVERLRARITGLFPKSLFAWCMFVGVVVLIAVGLWGLLSTPSAPSVHGTWSASLEAPSPKSVWEWTKNYWLWIALILAIPFLVLSVVKQPWAGALQSGIVVLGIALFVAVPLVDLIWGNENPSSQSSQGCPLFSSSKVSKCMMTKKKVVVTADQLTSAGEFEFCAVVPEGSAFHIVQIRTNTLEMWSSDGEFPAEYKMIKHNDLVNGKCPNRF